jgi:UDP-N-acetylglucosamine 2-epimerase (non-hydrolysing)
VIALREATERGEAVEAGAVVCVGPSRDRIVDTVNHLLSDAQAYTEMQVEHSPFGDGHAAERIVEWMLDAIP